MADLVVVFRELTAALAKRGIDANAAGVSEPLKVAISTAYEQGAELHRELPTLPLCVPLSVERLAIALRDAFETDQWGDIDPYLFNEAIAPVEDSDHACDAEALRGTLRRAVDALNMGVSS